MRQLIVAALCGMLTAGAGAQDDYTPPTGKLLKMVVVSRHGVRSPLEANSALAAWTKLLTCDKLTPQSIAVMRNFRKAFTDKGPEFIP